MKSTRTAEGRCCCRSMACTRRPWARASRSPRQAKVPTARSPSEGIALGYWRSRESKQEAIEWAKRCPGSPNEVIEIRQVQEMEDFPPDVQEAARGFTEMQGQGGQRKR